MKFAGSNVLTGLWKAEHSYGSDTAGELKIHKGPTGWSAYFIGREIAMKEQDGIISFDLPDRKVAFRAVIRSDGTIGTAQWLQYKPELGLPRAFGLQLTSNVKNEWKANVVPEEDNLTYYLLINSRPDGSVGLLLRNRQWNIALTPKIDRMTQEGENIQLLGRRRGQDKESVLLSGSFDKQNDVIRLKFDPDIDGIFEFKRVGDDNEFYPRGRVPKKYVYRVPSKRDDGIPVASVEDANIDRKGIESFVQMVLEMPMEEYDAMQIDSILMMRNGKLVLEEYFHGFDREMLHSSRSAAKSITALLVGSAIQAGLPVGVSTPVYATMNGGHAPADLDPQKRAMTLEHLLTMTSGFFCDDGNPDAPGNEETLITQTTEPDFFAYTLRLPMDRKPGERPVYCSGDPNLAIGVLQRATGENAIDLFDRLIAGPIGIKRHSWFISPTRQPYGGGSMDLTPRDYLKLGELIRNNGTWKGRRILSDEFAKRAVAPLWDFNSIKYGYLWWGLDYPYKKRTVHANFAGGNGGQGIFVIPELDLVIAINGSSYGSRVGLEIQQGLIPRYILPAVREPGDPKNVPVVPQEYQLVYGRKPKT